MGFPTSARVIADYAVQYADPLSVRAGEAFTLTGREDLWQGHLWLWGVAADGRAGWVPAAWVERQSGQGVCQRDYSAQELGVSAGAPVTVLEAAGGWLWCADDKGRTGWVPAENVAVDAEAACGEAEIRGQRCCHRAVTGAGYTSA